MAMNGADPKTGRPSPFMVIKWICISAVLCFADGILFPLAGIHVWKSVLQQTPSPWMTQRPLGVDVNVGMCLCYVPFFVRGMALVFTLLGAKY
jgi:hypothetical protein